MVTKNWAISTGYRPPTEFHRNCTNCTSPIQQAPNLSLQPSGLSLSGTLAPSSRASSLSTSRHSGDASLIPEKISLSSYERNCGHAERLQVSPSFNVAPRPLAPKNTPLLAPPPTERCRQALQNPVSAPSTLDDLKQAATPTPERVCYQAIITEELENVPTSRTQKPAGKETLALTTPSTCRNRHYCGPCGMHIRRRERPGEPRAFRSSSRDTE